MIDEYFDYCYGRLEYRTLRFENEILDTDNYQGNAVVNYTEYEIPYTRIIETGILKIQNRIKQLLQENILIYGKKVLSRIIR